MATLLIFGPGYAAGFVAARAEARGWQVIRIDRAAFADAAQVHAAIAQASHILSSVPPEAERDAVLDRYGAAIAASGAAWIGYLSSTGVYGDVGGAWVDEGAPLLGRRGGRIAADRGWAALDPRVRVFRLPGIYGPGRSALKRVAAGRAHRIDLPAQIFSRIEVRDLAAGVAASWDLGPAGVYNLADDRPAGQNAVVEEASRLIGVALPPLLPLDEAGLSPAAAAFYAENRRVSAEKARRLLGWRPRFADYRAGLRDLSANTSPANTSAAPAALAAVQR